MINPKKYKVLRGGDGKKSELILWFGKVQIYFAT
jgi:hypothetical protein